MLSSKKPIERIGCRAIEEIFIRGIKQNSPSSQIVILAIRTLPSQAEQRGPLFTQALEQSNSLRFRSSSVKVCVGPQSGSAQLGVQRSYRSQVGLFVKARSFLLETLYLSR